MQCSRSVLPLVRLAASTLVLAAFSIPVAFAANTSYQVQQINPTGSTATFAVALNKNNSVVGNYTDSSSAVHGFAYTANKYTILDFPKSNQFTRANGINDSSLIVGDFLGADSFYHGFTLSNGKYTQYDVNLGSASTSIFGVNNAGDFVGATGSGGPNEGFINIGGAITEFYGSGTDNTFALAINNNNEVVGQFYDSSNNSHCFDRSSTGTIREIVYPGALQTACTGINDAGVIAGWYENASDQFYAFIDNAGAFTSLSFLSSGGINNAGAMVGYYVGPGSPGGENFGYLAIPHAMKGLTNLAVPKAQSTSIYGLNNAGNLVGQYTNASGQSHGLLAVGTKLTNIDDPKAAAGTTACYGINSAGIIVGFYATATSTDQGFMYASGTYTDIGPAGAVNSLAQTINDSGVIAGYYQDSGGIYHGFTFNGAAYTTIDVPGATYSEAWGVNASGEVTVIWGDANGFAESSIYNGTTFTTVNVPGALQTTAHSINKSGNIAFSWYDTYGNLHGAILENGAYFVFDDGAGTSTRGDGINDANVVVGRFLKPGSTTLFDAYKASN